MEHMPLTPPLTNDPNKQPQQKLSQRAARKAAAACIARSRHKAFVNNLQEQVDQRRRRVLALRNRAADRPRAAAANLCTQLKKLLSDERVSELGTWLKRSPELVAAWNDVEPAESPSAPIVGGTASTFAPPSAPVGKSVIKTPKAATPKATEARTPGRGKGSGKGSKANASGSSSKSSSDATRLDAELARQEFVAEAVVEAMEMEENDVEFEYGEGDDAMRINFNVEPEWEGEGDGVDGADLLNTLEMCQMYGDGLVTLLQHLSSVRPSTVEAWLQLKSEENGLDAESEWTNLTALEEDFVLMNDEHRPDVSIGGAAGVAMANAQRAACMTATAK